ncbi:MAG: helix-turn-helix transcriptional regulator [Thermoanaerobaculia bacterium]
MAAEEDIQRILALLKRAIRSSGYSQKDVDRQIGVKPGYLSQVMIGRLDLKVKHLLRALDAIQVDPAGFFGLAFPPDRSRPSSNADLLGMLPPGPGARTPLGVEAVNVLDEIPDEEFRRIVARALAEELGLSFGSQELVP